MQLLNLATARSCTLLLLVAAQPLLAAEPGAPLLYRKLAVPESLLTTKKNVTFGGDVRVGDLTGDGRCDLLVFRNARGGTKPCFLGAFTIDGKVLWQVGSGGDVPMRPGPVAIHDLDGDGQDEVTGGCHLLDDDGKPLWERLLGPHMDSVAITEWDGGRVRAVGSGAGHVMDDEGNVILGLGPEAVPHGQEVRVADFLAESAGPEMVIRYDGHRPDVMLVSSSGQIVKRFKLNDFPPKNIGMEAVYWHGPERPALLYNGGKLWQATGALFAELPQFPGPSFWSFCIPANLCGDDREEMLIYNPADRFLYVYTPSPLDEAAFRGYRAGPRQYNVRLMD